MKKLFFLLLILPITFSSCGSDGDKEDEDPVVNQPKSIVGVWENENYFVSFGSDGFYTAYIADRFIDSGNYIESKDVVSCENAYFNRKTIYTIKSISDTKLNVDISYTDIYGDKQNKIVTFTKSVTTPASQSKTLAGKSYRSSSSIFGNVTMTFSSYNSNKIGNQRKCRKVSFVIFLCLYWGKTIPSNT